MADEDLMKKRQEWYEKAKKEGKLKANPTEDHRAGLEALQHPVRRGILRRLGEGRMRFDQIKEEFQLDDMHATFDLRMLEDTLYIEKEEKDGTYEYYLTPRGEAFLENVESKHL
ncbi:winged helix-turn-helix transcriptional regulator [Methanolobus zinderi]|uniref:Winged helix-turn-helix transcriptional regulator n=1 Tax=Methanolobus zinderi TaxID=536044 RepID=A0A7D5ECZ3_9EURY|nr:winged helix-turn-helix domain-containing protein [Methanolobus zinderi]QLC49134.1 winged helix-turn-helix transcriptional regulator [Methanolobus zinderi]